jgi:hypothetical protein
MIVSTTALTGAEVVGQANYVWLEADELTAVGQELAAARPRRAWTASLRHGHRACH